ncbi:hypothetical protein GGTG_05861 [Gaeumannomyces tritici R3-111a-1]|uniref:Uncharacterized protein n=1 Tax=Gaeumannomyces tritici (strain R3-111a-1) TaxID=644352 RepID=J3NX54_GAET3|nr:hypothetical protein GGTG_05861 [Gaeumannomyces tritici R3-111a-1]EJT75936.1 hypothetical protein GGTG_05861 [Gaeumannomyces tritici R3-111a-1]
MGLTMDLDPSSAPPAVLGHNAARQAIPSHQEGAKPDHMVTRPKPAPPVGIPSRTDKRGAAAGSEVDNCLLGSAGWGSVASILPSSLCVPANQIENSFARRTRCAGEGHPTEKSRAVTPRALGLSGIVNIDEWDDVGDSVFVLINAGEQTGATARHPDNAILGRERAA